MVFSFEGDNISFERDNFSFERDNFLSEPDNLSLERDSFSLKKNNPLDVTLKLRRIKLKPDRIGIIASALLDCCLE